MPSGPTATEVTPRVCGIGRAPVGSPVAASSSSATLSRRAMSIFVPSGVYRASSKPSPTFQARSRANVSPLRMMTWSP